MFKHYRMTRLEKFLEDTYSRIGIRKYHQITVSEISKKLKVWIHYLPAGSRAVEAKQGVYSMILDCRISSIQQRLDFFHELCHLLQHAGNQTLLPELFTQAQEEEAERFVMYASMPFSIISQLTLPNKRDQAIEYISTIFDVPIDLARKRFEQIERRDLQGKLDAALAQKMGINESAAAEEISVEGTGIYAYYDSTADIPGPSQLVIEADEAAMDSGKDFLFPIDGPLKRLELEDFYGYKCTKLSAQDIRFKKGHLCVNFSIISMKYGKSAKRFVIQMKDVERLVRFYIY
ncbi:ImmA/IrrE family metallo-endopeptidase [Paenibacillus sp. SN-8-1]|uniref:ImmA/IrrE family metallo-endopeptidase n=1 Tax=Paenibacillus sp. SN-8-1 TaxID=3435409 RepID=UPI003D9A1347